MFYSCEKSISRKNRVLPIEKFPSVVLPRNAIILQHLTGIIQICQVVAYWRLKTKENFKLLALKVVTVTFERWSLIRSSKYSDLTWKLSVLLFPVQFVFLLLLRQNISMKPGKFKHVRIYSFPLFLQPALN